MSKESIKPRSPTGNSLDSEIINNYAEEQVKLKGICSKQDIVLFIHGKVVNLFICYEQNTWSRHSNPDFAIGIQLFGAVKLNINDNPDKQVKLKGICSNQDIVLFIHGKVVNLFSFYEQDTRSRHSNANVTIDIQLFGAGKLNINDNPHKHGYSNYGVTFDARSQFLCSEGSWGKRYFWSWK